MQAVARKAEELGRRAGEAAVVNVVSVAGKNSFVQGSGYAATKHALLAFSRCLMLEERKNGIRVLAICPGSVATQFNHPDPDFSKKKERFLQAGDVAQAILCSL